MIGSRAAARAVETNEGGGDGGNSMKATRILYDLGQSLWLDNITRDLLTRGTLRRYIDELSVTGLTSNPTIFDHAIKNSSDYDSAIKSKLAQGKSGEKLFFELALEDIREAADLFRPVHDRTCGAFGGKADLSRPPEPIRSGAAKVLPPVMEPAGGSVT